MPAGLQTKLGIKDADYGSKCLPWDAVDCKTYYAGTDLTDAMWCCQSWCYVGEKCATANKDHRYPEGFVSYAVCKEEKTQEESISSCPYSNACDCSGSNTGLSAADLTKLGADY